MLSTAEWKIILRYGMMAMAGAVVISAIPYAVGDPSWFTSTSTNIAFTLGKLGWTVACAVLAGRRLALLNDGHLPFHYALIAAWAIFILMGTADIAHYYIRMNHWHPEQFEWVRDIQLQQMEKQWLAEALSEAEIQSRRAEFLSGFQRPTLGTAAYQWGLWLIISFGLALVVAAFTKKQRR